MARYIMPVLIGVLGTAVLLWLGVWQVQRLDWKEGVLAEIENRQNRDPVALPDKPTEDLHKFLPVRVSGTADTENTLYVFTPLKDIGVRLRVIQAVDVPEGRRILVERGVIAPELFGRIDWSQSLAVTGMLHWPDEVDLFTPLPDATTGQWYARDLDAMANALGTEPVLVVASMVVPVDPMVIPYPLDTSAIANDHLQYAVTWFGLALVWIGMTIYWVRRIARHQYLYGETR